MILKRCITLCLLGAFTSGFAQTVSINKINERRSTGDGFFDNRCEIEFKITGDEVRKYKLVKVSKISTVVDDQGLNLVKEEKFRYDEIDNSAMVKIETKIPARKATVIKEISGEIALYNPTDENGAIVRIANYQSKTNINLVPGVSGFQLVYLTKESAEKYAKDQKAKKEEELKKLPEPARKMSEQILNAVEGLQAAGSGPNDLTFVVQGDDAKLIDLYLEDENGKRVKHSGYSQMNSVRSYSFNEKPNPSWKLVLNVESDASIKKIPFTLTNIALP